MLQVGGDLDLREEPLGAEHGAELRLEHLDRDLAIVLEVVGEIDRGHAALAELPLDAVAVGKCGCQAFTCRGHRFALSTAAVICATQLGTARR